MGYFVTLLFFRKCLYTLTASLLLLHCMDCADLIMQQTEFAGGDFTPLGEADTNFPCVCMYASFLHTHTHTNTTNYTHTHIFFSKQTSLLTTLAFCWKSWENKHMTDACHVVQCANRKCSYTMASKQQGSLRSTPRSRAPGCEGIRILKLKAT